MNHIFELQLVSLPQPPLSNGSSTKWLVFYEAKRMIRPEIVSILAYANFTYTSLIILKVISFFLITCVCWGWGGYAFECRSLWRAESL